MPAPIIGIGLGIQFENWGYEHIEHVRNVQSAMESLSRHTPSLLVIDADWPDTQESFRLIQRLRAGSKTIPVIFISKHNQTPDWKDGH